MISKISIFVFIFLSFPLFPQSDIKIISSDRNSIVIEYNPVLDTASKFVDNVQYIELNLLNGVYKIDNWGLPAVPERHINIGVPSEFGNTIQVTSYLTTEMNGQVLPIPAMMPDGNFHQYLYEKSAEYISYHSAPALVTFGSFGISRGIPMQTLQIHPIQYEPQTGKIVFYSRIIFSINFNPAQRITATVRDELTGSSMINKDVALAWAVANYSNRLKKTVTSSVLANGKWVRFEVDEDGMYKIDYSMLSSFGIDPNTVDPRTIKIYNNGGKMIPENILHPRSQDLVENAIRVVGEDDGKFDQNDYIVFYGRGNNFWDYDTTSGFIQRNFNLYSNKNYYWITSGGIAGKRIEGKESLNQSNYFAQTTSEAFAQWEEDKINIGKTGRIFLGDDFSQSVRTRTYTNKLNYRVPGSLINYRVRFVVASSQSIQLEIQETNNTIFSSTLLGYGNSTYTVGEAHIRNLTYSGALADDRSVLKFNFTPSQITSMGYLDFFEIKYSRELKPSDDLLIFYSKDSTAVIEYRLSGFPSTNIKVFDVSDPFNVKHITNHTMLSGGECRFQVSESASYRSKYVAIGNDNYKTPSNPVEVQNSDIRGISEGAQFIIITHKNFLDAANKLKNYRENQSLIRYSTKVIDIESIYNEFGGGISDPSAVRDFIKYAYDNWQIRPEYVLLMGKGTYDYKNVEGQNENFIPTWQTIESLVLVRGSVSSYTTDDFFVKVDGNDDFVDLAIGRITARSLVEANNIVDKIIAYENDSDRTPWRNLVTLVADDGFGTGNRYEGAEHTAPSEILATTKIPLSYDINKIYMAAYPDELTSAGRRKPEVNKAIIDAVNQGTLIMNYIGHGSPELWAHEVVFEKSVTIPQFQNDRYFFMTAGTCDFGYFDIPNFQSAAEEMMLISNRGAIGVFTASRLVYSQLNHQLMYRFFVELLQPRDTLNLLSTLGQAYFRTKQLFTGVNDQKYHIFGDPTLRLIAPQHFGSIDSINGQALTSGVQIKALSKAGIEGRILKPDGSTWSDFNGEGLLTVFDSERIVRLTSINFDVLEQGGVIFRGRISVTNGNFSADFVVPKDISYENKNGKVLLYFFDQHADGLAFTNNIVVGGTDTTAVDDGKGPEIEIYFDDTSFRNAYLINPNSLLIVKLEDETGLNTTGTGVGHKLEGILNDRENDPIDFTNFFIGDLDAGGKSGEVRYRFNNLDEGEYKILVKAWDVFNNFSSESAYFSVVSGDDLIIRDVYNYPNPFTSNTTFTFQQNMSKILDCRIRIYTVAGRLIREIERKNISDKFVTIDWDGRDQDGSPIANGTYFYKLIVNTVDGEYSRSVLGKIAVIR